MSAMLKWFCFCLLPSERVYTQTHTQTHTHTNTDTHTDTQTQIHTHTHRHTQTHTRKGASLNIPLSYSVVELL